MPAQITIIPELKLPALALILKTRLPKSARLFNVLQFYFQNRISDATFYSLGTITDGSKDQNVLLLCRQKLKTLEHFITVSEPQDPDYLTNENCEMFENLIDWTVPNQFGAMSSRLTARCLDMCKRRGVDTTAFECRVYVLSHEVACDLDICESTTVKIDRLSLPDVSKVAGFWKFTKPKTLEMMRDCVERVGAMGVYVDGELASWILTIQSGNFFALQTDPKFQGRGYGKLALKAVCKYGRDNEFVPVTLVEPYNVQAMYLMENVGMEHVDDIYFVETSLEHQNGVNNYF